eukprot:CAMPEP_0185701558 /NCGR_PEP_ID=MMETSP1164-20130828/9724_1 /TAXON_ID=1104430 /ORGANISM="Chrysoreinhardia sp, Strain CCMP2950" /LENGTH=245 /DNA_ID=CAMNT_0028368627 /DNA_START=44 /DNA_END=778 /DNA_ORIENTATION=+
MSGPTITVAALLCARAAEAYFGGASLGAAARRLASAANCSRVRFSSKRVITRTAEGASSVAAADLDADGDVDVVSASIWDDTIAWYENDGGSRPSFTKHVITTTADGANSVAVADLDADRDVDVLSASYEDDTVAWYENDGAGNFTKHVITTTADGAWSVAAADLDGDDDVDVLSASEDDNTVAWYENDGGSPPTFTMHVITTTASYASSVTAADLDADQDLDVLAAAFGGDTVAWYENDGASPP